MPDTLLPTVAVTPVTITIEIRLAIRAYSMAVAPQLSDRPAETSHKRSRSMGISGKSAAGMG